MKITPSTYKITFPLQKAAEADKFTGSLQSALQGSVRGLVADRLKGDQSTQSAGEVLRIVVPPLAVTSLASGVATWLARNSSATLQVDMPDGTHVAMKYIGEDTAEAVKAIFARGQQA